MFDAYRNRIESEIQAAISALGEKTKLRDACEYALKSGGKRLRPLFVVMISNALGHGLDAIQSALSVEFFHTASLIADDLPCMDNDDERRARPSLHRVFGESVALLASYTFIACGYEGIYKNGQRMKADLRFSKSADAATIACLEIATRCAGIKGATNGQFLDLFPPDTTLQTIQKIIAQKTVTLFQISFVFGWLFGGGEAALLKKVEDTAYHLGMAFQIADDLHDERQDAAHRCEINIAAALGTSRALAFFEEEMTKFEAGLQELGIWNGDFEQAAGYLRGLIPAVIN
ncbi:MAG TPA: polyprenyl synthetase family protein [Chlamydiales bacterium]|jgi:geranylgeranyl diphosphate synthase type II|nr:polyprenyl synthetase family protein [Chlamydiales bacterium]